MNFRFRNVEDAHTITSAMKYLMEVSLFQWSQVFKNPEGKLMIDLWFVKFKVSMYLNSYYYYYYYYVNSFSLLILLTNSFTNLICKKKFY